MPSALQMKLYDSNWACQPNNLGSGLKLSVFFFLSLPFFFSFLSFHFSFSLVVCSFVLWHCKQDLAMAANKWMSIFESELLYSFGDLLALKFSRKDQDQP